VARLSRLFTAERSVITLIVINTVALIVMGFSDPRLGGSHTAERIYDVARWVDFGCVAFFVIETLTKLRTYGWRQYWSSGWNRFDFVVVLLSAPVLLSPLLPLHELGTFLALRLGRLFRLFRVMRFIPNRAHLYSGIKRALRASVGVFLALLIFNLVLSLGATQLFGEVAPEFFGNPALSSYSLFRVFTVEGWHEIPDAIAQRSHPLLAVMARLYFVVCVLLGGILGLGLANAVFVDEMTTDNTDELERKVDALGEEIRALREALENTK